jgi:hypothetical protein
MQKMGFKEIHHADIMDAADRLYPWGYDDCAFYRRVFERLAREQTEQSPPLFAYLQVSSHHYPWKPKRTYAETHLFPKPSNFRENYANSALEQDYCLKIFYERFTSFFSGDGRRAHLFILPDHSWPVGLNPEGNVFNDRGAYNENFLIPVLYIPPAERKNEFRIGQRVHARFDETDILPTVFELLNRRNYQNSFAPALKTDDGGGNYEDCHELRQPYGGGQVAIVSGERKYVYSVQNKTITLYDLRHDFQCCSVSTPALVCEPARLSCCPSPAERHRGRAPTAMKSLRYRNTDHFNGATTFTYTLRIEYTTL